MEQQAPNSIDFCFVGLFVVPLGLSEVSFLAPKSILEAGFPGALDCARRDTNKKGRQLKNSAQPKTVLIFCHYVSVFEVFVGLSEAFFGAQAAAWRPLSRTGRLAQGAWPQ